MLERKFERGQLGKYSLEEKNEFGKLCKKYKNEYDNIVEENKDKPKYDIRLKQHSKMLPRKGFIAKAVRKDLRNAKHDNPNFVKALKLGKRCL